MSEYKPKSLFSGRSLSSQLVCPVFMAPLNKYTPKAGGLSAFGSSQLIMSFNNTVAIKAPKRLWLSSFFECNSFFKGKTETDHKNSVNKCIVIMEGFMKALKMWNQESRQQFVKRMRVILQRWIILYRNWWVSVFDFLFKLGWVSFSFQISCFPLQRFVSVLIVKYTKSIYLKMPIM